MIGPEEIHLAATVIEAMAKAEPTNVNDRLEIIGVDPDVTAAMVQEAEVLAAQNARSPGGTATFYFAMGAAAARIVGGLDPQTGRPILEEVRDAG